MIKVYNTYVTHKYLTTHICHGIQEESRERFGSYPWPCAYRGLGSTQDNHKFLFFKFQDLVPSQHTPFSINHPYCYTWLSWTQRYHPCGSQHWSQINCSTPLLHHQIRHLPNWGCTSWSHVCLIHTPILCSPVSGTHQNNPPKVSWYLTHQHLSPKHARPVPNLPDPWLHHGHHSGKSSPSGHTH